MNKIFWLCCCFSAVFCMAPCPSFSEHLIGCTACHEGGRACLSCHDEESTRPEKALEVATHSSALIGSDQYGQWERDCMDCHQPHHHNKLMAGAEGGISDDSIVIADLRINNVVTNGTRLTFQLEQVDIHDSAWASPDTWPQKTRPGRGLLLVMYYDQYQGYIWYEVMDTTDSTITVGENYRNFPGGDHPINAQLVYGMLIQDAIDAPDENGIFRPVIVNFTGPSSLADDESGTGVDPTPDGVCQVCHTQTLHWRSNGSLADHFSGWNCILCHPHEKGFKADPPQLDICEEVNLPGWDCDGTWGGDKILDNCGNCDNDPENDCEADCNGDWGGDAIWDACHICGGDSTSCEDDESSEYYPVDRSGTVTVAVTGLMWQQATADVNLSGGWDAGDKLTYYDAVDYCNELLFAGYTDWYLPTRKELKGLVQCVDSAGNTTKETPLANGAYCGGAYVRPTIDTTVFSIANRPYWTSNVGWIVNFWTGRTWTTWNAPYYVRCVRQP